MKFDEGKNRALDNTYIKCFGLHLSRNMFIFARRQWKDAGKGSHKFSMVIKTDENIKIWIKNRAT